MPAPFKLQDASAEVAPIAKALRILVVTGSPDDAGAQIQADPCARVLAKPVRPEALALALAELLG